MKKLNQKHVAVMSLVTALTVGSSGTVLAKSTSVGTKGKVPTVISLQQQIDKIKKTPGPVGPQGPKGDTGLRGPKGDTGQQGPKGKTGQQGSKGNTGQQGPKGNTGQAGAPGPLSDLVCVDGSVAVSNNDSWVCSENLLSLLETGTSPSQTIQPADPVGEHSSSLPAVGIVPIKVNITDDDSAGDDLFFWNQWSGGNTLSIPVTNSYNSVDEVTTDTYKNDINELVLKGNFVTTNLINKNTTVTANPINKDNAVTRKQFSVDFDGGLDNWATYVSKADLGSLKFIKQTLQSYQPAISHSPTQDQATLEPIVLTAKTLIDTDSVAYQWRQQFFAIVASGENISDAYKSFVVNLHSGDSDPQSVVASYSFSNCVPLGWESSLTGSIQDLYVLEKLTVQCKDISIDTPSEEINQWISSQLNLDNANSGFRNVTITELDTDGGDLRSYNFSNAFITDYKLPSLNSASNALVSEEIRIQPNL